MKSIGLFTTYKLAYALSFALVYPATAEQYKSSDDSSGERYVTSNVCIYVQANFEFVCEGWVIAHYLNAAYFWFHNFIMFHILSNSAKQRWFIWTGMIFKISEFGWDLWCFITVDFNRVLYFNFGKKVRIKLFLSASTFIKQFWKYSGLKLSRLERSTKVSYVLY